MEPKVFKIHDRLKTFPPAQMVYILYRRLVEQGPRTTLMWFKDKFWRQVNGVAPAKLSQVGPGIFIGGQHRKHGLARMRAMGISAVVNLREESDDAARGLGLDAYLWLPTTDDTPPKVDDLERGAAFIGEQIDAGRGVYIHCASGVGRAPTMAAAYLVSQGLEPVKAWTQILRARPFVRPTLAQLRIIEAFAAHKTMTDERTERAFSAILEDTALTADLTDAVAKRLLSWAEQRVRRLVTETAQLDDQAAAQALAPQIASLRQQARSMAKDAASSTDPGAALARSLAAADSPQNQA